MTVKRNLTTLQEELVPLRFAPTTPRPLGSRLTVSSDSLPDDRRGRDANRFAAGAVTEYIDDTNTTTATTWITSESGRYRYHRYQHPFNRTLRHPSSTFSIRHSRLRSDFKVTSGGRRPCVARPTTTTTTASYRARSTSLGPFWSIFTVLAHRHYSISYPTSPSSINSGGWWAPTTTLAGATLTSLPGAGTRFIWSPIPLHNM
ncbi:hypothetical protein GE09DRAFT_546682 [Coniochaeta sp. 2T2.1]|nr:hypothetical protein GE09DRAFT_546682 [Coniochaeta sp. 2T2.1]